MQSAQEEMKNLLQTPTPSLSLRVAIYQPFRSSSRDFSILPFPKRQILDSSKLKEFADDYFKFDENDRKLSKRIKDTERKGEILVKSNFSFSQRFLKTCTADT